MMDRLLPPITAGYTGQPVALWLFGALLLVRGIIGLNSIVNGRTVAMTADGIPLDSFPAAAAQTIVALWALLGLGRLVMSGLGAVVLVRYRALVPLCFGLLLLEQLGRYLVVRFIPIPRTGAPPASAINLTLLGATIAGLALSLWSRSGGSPG